ncbi:MAG TPA: hypothetical protein PLZ67_00085 [Bacteroidales bacterium]|nr:hypothetical protein [Bacteroidales bacterium]
MIKKIFFTGIIFLCAIGAYAVNQMDDCGGVPDTITVVFEKQFSNNNVKVFHNDSLILKEKATTLRKHGLEVTGVGTQIFVKSEKDKVIVRCGIWSKRIRIKNDKPNVYIHRVWGLGFLWVRYLEKPRGFR